MLSVDIFIVTFFLDNAFLTNSSSLLLKPLDLKLPAGITD